MSNLVIKFAGTTVIDVFNGDGWENWTRFVRQGNKLHKVAGNILSKEEFNHVCKVVFHK